MIACPTQAATFHADGSILAFVDQQPVPLQSYSLDLGIEAGDGVNYDNFGPTIPDQHAQANSQADGLGLHAHAFAQLITPPLGFNNEYGLSANANAWTTFVDVRMKGPVGGIVSTALNLHLEGSHLAGAAHDPGFGLTFADSVVSIQVSIDGLGIGGGTHAIDVISGSAPQVSASGMLANWDAAGNIVTPAFNVHVGVPFQVQLQLSTVAHVDGFPFNFAGLSAEANTDFSHTLSFALTGPVFNVPDGYTVDSAEAGIVNNSFVGVPHADYNHDGIVDAADYTIWRNTLGQSGSGLAADGTGAGGVPDGVVDQLDYDFWKANFGNHSGAGASANSDVPEPSTCVLLIFAATGWCLQCVRTG